MYEADIIHQREKLKRMSNESRAQVQSKELADVRKIVMSTRDSEEVVMSRSHPSTSHAGCLSRSPSLLVNGKRVSPAIRVVKATCHLGGTRLSASWIPSGL